MFISTALTAPQHYDINCDKANEISANIYASIIKHTHLRKCPEKRRLLLYLGCTVHLKQIMSGKYKSFDTFLLIYFASWTWRGDKPFSEYELTNYPLSLFKDGMMRNGKKASLCSFLMKVIPNANLTTEIVQVNDGEALLFQIKSFLFTNFSDMYKSYEKHLYSKYG